MASQIIIAAIVFPRREIKFQEIGSIALSRNLFVALALELPTVFQASSTDHPISRQTGIGALRLTGLAFSRQPCQGDCSSCD
jgi:hypothetical protein